MGGISNENIYYWANISQKKEPRWITAIRLKILIHLYPLMGITFHLPEESDQIGNALMIDFSAANVNSIEDYLGQWKNCTRTPKDEVSLKWLECTDVPYVDGQKKMFGKIWH